MASIPVKLQICSTSVFGTLSLHGICAIRRIDSAWETGLVSEWVEFNATPDTGLVSLYCGDTDSTFHSRREGWLERQHGTRRFWYLLGCHERPRSDAYVCRRQSWLWQYDSWCLLLFYLTSECCRIAEFVYHWQFDISGCDRWTNVGRSIYLLTYLLNVALRLLVLLWTI